MRSPIDHDVRLKRVKLEDGLNVFTCPVSHGIWIPAQDYWSWLSSQPERLPHLPANQEDGNVPGQLDGDNSRSILLCPESGTPMARFQVGHAFKFSIDRSVTGGVWLDAGEWQALRKRNFHDEIHLVFSAPWQRKIQEQRQLASRVAMIKERVGEESWEKISDFKRWLAGLDTEARSAVIAWITAVEDEM